MNCFFRNLPYPLRFRVSHGLSVALGKQPLVFSSSAVMVPTPTAAVNLLLDEVGSLVLVPSHGHSVNEDPATSVEPFELAPGMERRK